MNYELQIKVLKTTTIKQKMYNDNESALMFHICYCYWACEREKGFFCNDITCYCKSWYCISSADRNFPPS